MERLSRYLTDGLVVSGHRHQVVDIDAVPVEHLKSPLTAAGGTSHQDLVFGRFAFQRFVPQGVVGMDERLGVERLGWAG